MNIVTIHEVETHLASLLYRVEQGEHILIERDGKTVAEFAPIVHYSSRRQAGIDQGRIRIAEDFDAPLSNEVLRDFVQ